MQKVCCPAMKQAIKDEFVHWPITYTRTRVASRLTPTINSRSASPPNFALNFCPWCKEDVRVK